MKTLNNEFSTWLQTLGFAKSSVISLPIYTLEMLQWLQAQNITKAQHIQAIHIQDYFNHWKNRKNKRTGAGLSQPHINKGITAINLFIKFLNKTQHNTIQLQLQRDKQHPKTPNVLSIQEIEQLYQASYNIHKRANTLAYGQRDRAMLAIYYGCGLRKNEGINLQTTDILLSQKLLLVRNGKGNKQRYVPLAEQSSRDIEEYLNHGRKWFLQPRQKDLSRHLSSGRQIETNAFFINLKGQPIQSFTARLNILKEEANINQPFTLHTLRHSIATHLLQKGMDIEHIKKFLGHSTLESTQLYTHIINEQI